MKKCFSALKIIFSTMKNFISILKKVLPEACSAFWGSNLVILLGPLAKGVAVAGTDSREGVRWKKISEISEG